MGLLASRTKQIERTMKMVSKKKIVVAVITALALSVGVAGTASAHSKGPKTASERDCLLWFGQRQEPI